MEIDVKVHAVLLCVMETISVILDSIPRAGLTPDLESPTRICDSGGGGGGRDLLATAF